MLWGDPALHLAGVEGGWFSKGFPSSRLALWEDFCTPLGPWRCPRSCPHPSIADTRAACFGFAKFSEWGLPAPFQGQTCPWVENNANSVSSQPKVELWSIHWEQG